MLNSSFDSCRAAPGFLEMGGGGALRLGPLVALFSLLLERLGEAPPTFGGSTKSFFFRGVTCGGVLELERGGESAG